MCVCRAAVLLVVVFVAVLVAGWFRKCLNKGFPVPPPPPIAVARHEDVSTPFEGACLALLANVDRWV